MTTLTDAAPAPATDEAPLLSPAARVRLAILAALFLALHWELIYRLGRFAWNDGDWSHAFLVPLFSLYFIHQQREQIAAAVPRPFWPALGVMLAGMGGYFAAMTIGSDMLRGYAMIVELAGLTLLMVGPAVMRYLWFPILYLAFAVKVSEPIWSAVAHRLQLLAAEAAVGLLNIIGVEAAATQTTIDVYEGLNLLGSLNVAEACSGMRMLMTFLALSVAMAYLWNRPWWAKLMLVGLTVPIAIVVNVARVTLLGVLYTLDPEYTRGDFHIFMGMLMLIPALGLLLLTLWIMNQLIAEDSGTRVLTSNSESGSSNSKPAFTVAAAVLVLAAVGVHAFTLSQGHQLVTGDAQLRQPLYLFPKELGPYRRTGEQTLSREVVDEMGTTRYILWTYQPHGAASIRLLISFHSGMADSSPHVHERHYTAGGGTAKPLEQRTIGSVPLTLAQLSPRLHDAVLGYFYVANGQLVATAKEARAIVRNPREPYPYWCKVEIMPGDMHDVVGGAEFNGVASPTMALEIIEPFVPHLIEPLMDTLPERPDD